MDNNFSILQQKKNRKGGISNIVMMMEMKREKNNYLLTTERNIHLYFEQNIKIIIIFSSSLFHNSIFHVIISYCYKFLFCYAKVHGWKSVKGRKYCKNCLF